MHQALQGATFHVEHIIPTASGGSDELPNLAWACPSCNLKKSNRQTAVDPETEKAVALFHPRTHRWEERSLRAHLANPDVDLETHVQDILNVIKYEDMHDVVLLGHSYGGMVATGVADRARDSINQVIYLDAFVPREGQCLLDFLPESERQRMRSGAASGDGWRIPPNPTPPALILPW